MEEKGLFGHRKNDAIPVTEINSNGISDKANVRPQIAGVPGLDGRIYPAVPRESAPPIGFAAVDSDLAIENLENDWDMTAADLQDFRGQKG